MSKSLDVVIMMMENVSKAKLKLEFFAKSAEGITRRDRSLGLLLEDFNEMRRHLSSLETNYNDRISKFKKDVRYFEDEFNRLSLGESEGVERVHSLAEKLLSGLGAIQRELEEMFNDYQKKINSIKSALDSHANGPLKRKINAFIGYAGPNWQNSPIGEYYSMFFKMGNSLNQELNESAERIASRIGEVSNSKNKVDNFLDKQIKLALRKKRGN